MVTGKCYYQFISPGRTGSKVYYQSGPDWLKSVFGSHKI